MSNERHKVKVDIDITSDIEYHTINEVIENFKALALEHGGDKSIWIDSSDDGYGSTSIRITLMGIERDETDREMSARLIREEAFKNMRRVQYLNLKKEFEG